MVPAGNDWGGNRNDWTDAAIRLGNDRVAEHPDPRAGTFFDLEAGGYPDRLRNWIFRSRRMAIQEDGIMSRHCLTD